MIQDVIRPATRFDFAHLCSVAKVVALPVAAETPSVSWRRAEVTDAFSGDAYSKFVLVGKFLEAPRDSHLTAPALVLSCKDRPHSVGYHLSTGGDRISSYVDFGTVLDRGAYGTVPVAFRLDDGKAQTETWSISKDGTAIFFGQTTLENLLYGHMLPHKDNSSAPVRKVVMMVGEADAASVVAEFDMPDPAEVGEACGATVHKR